MTSKPFQCSIKTQNQVGFTLLNLATFSKLIFFNFDIEIKTDMKIKHLIDVITTALEFEGIPIRHAEDKILKALCE